MEDMGVPTTQPCRGPFSEFRPYERLVLPQMIDFLPGVVPYDSTIAVHFFAAPLGRVRMVVTLSLGVEPAMVQRRAFKTTPAGGARPQTC